MRRKERRAIERLQAHNQKLDRWSAENEEKRGARGNIKQSNIIDNQSAKMPCAHGVVQGYNGVAAVDSEHQVTLFESRGPKGTKSFTEQMVERFDTATGRFLYSRRVGIVEPVFANVCHALGLRRFSMRGKLKVDIQWKLFSMVHNLKKLARYGPRFAQWPA